LDIDALLGRSLVQGIVVALVVGAIVFLAFEAVFGDWLATSHLHAVVRRLGRGLSHAVLAAAAALMFTAIALPVAYLVVHLLNLQLQAAQGAAILFAIGVLLYVRATVKDRKGGAA
jgi:hypothetical protein